MNSGHSVLQVDAIIFVNKPASQYGVSNLFAFHGFLGVKAILFGRGGGGQPTLLPDQSVNLKARYWMAGGMHEHLH